MRLVGYGLIGVLIALVGCTSQELAQQGLIRQMDGGLEEIRAAADQRQRLLEELYAGRRQRLDEAFDADVHQRQELEGAWVIEHRRAYRAALEGLWQQEQASREAHLGTRQNLEAVREGLRQLEMISRQRKQWWETVEQLKDRKEVNDAQR